MKYCQDLVCLFQISNSRYLHQLQRPIVESTVAFGELMYFSILSIV